MMYAVSNGATEMLLQREDYLFNQHLRRRIDIPYRHKLSILGCQYGQALSWFVNLGRI